MAVAFGFSFPSSMNKPPIVASKPSKAPVLLVAFMPKQSSHAQASVSLFSSSTRRLCRAKAVSEKEGKESDNEDKKELMEKSEKFLDYIKEHIPSSDERWSHYQTQREWNGYAHYAMKKLSEEKEMIYLDDKKWVKGYEQTYFWFQLSSNRLAEIAVGDKSILFFIEGKEEPIQENKFWDLISQVDAEAEEKKSTEQIGRGGEVETANGGGKENN